jgi:TonB family protein
MDMQEEKQESMSSLEKFIDTIYESKYGIMGTLAFHMIIAIFLLFTNIQSYQKPPKLEITIDFDQDIDKKIEKLKEEVEEKKVERQKLREQQVSKLLKSIAVNENIKSKADNTKDLNKLIDDIQKKLDAKNGNMYKKSSAKYKADSIKYHKEEALRKLDSIQTVYYSGPSSVSYNLKGRYKEYLPIPVFKCEESGMVKVEIIVYANGRVKSAKILESDSLSEDRCLWDTAIDAARRSRFSESSTRQQKGSITYNFVKQ